MEKKPSFGEAEQNAIHSTASRILDHPSFRSSERSTRLFRYLLNRAVMGDAAGLKERHIGNELFGRDIDYDTSSDPIVRNAASEMRKRLRQYDAESGSQDAVRILLEPGTYVLSFHFPIRDKDQATSHQPAPPSAHVLPNSAGDRPSTHRQPVLHLPIWKRTQFSYLVAALASICCAFLAFALYHQNREYRQTAGGPKLLDPLWKPMFSSGKEVFISLGHADAVGPSDSALTLTSGALQRITVTDLKAYTNISGFLQLHQRSFQMRTDTETTLLDLRDRPVVLIGIHNNRWALRLTRNLRYKFDFDESDVNKPTRLAGIVDSQNRGRNVWQVPTNVNATPAVDYAIAARFFDPVTGGLVMYMAGAGPVGTQAASEFVTQARFFNTVPADVSNPRINFEVVLKTPIVAGIPGSPEVIATDIENGSK